jgi:hypothetical protein
MSSLYNYNDSDKLYNYNDSDKLYNYNDSDKLYNNYGDNQKQKVIIVQKSSILRPILLGALGVWVYKKFNK